MESAVESAESQISSSSKQKDKSVQQVNPEIERFNQLRQNVIEKELKSHKSCWSTTRRQQLENIIQDLIVFNIIGGLVLGFITTLWFHRFAIVNNVFPITIVNNKGVHINATVKSSFITDINVVEDAIEHYLLGILLMIEGGIVANVARNSTFATRPWLYLAVIVAFAGSALFAVVAPFSALSIENSEKEIQNLNSDQYHAYHVLGIKGSIKYFRMHQCDKLIEGKEKLQRQRMKKFCDILSQLVYFFYFMWITSLLPIVSLLAFSLELFVNRKSWAMKAVHRLKPIKIKPTPTKEPENKVHSQPLRVESIV